MTTEPVRASAEWLTMREAADATARATDLVELIRPCLPTDRPLEIHDLGCGTGSMARWLAPQLPGPQHWVSYERDAELLALVHDTTPGKTSDGTPVTVETRRRDVTRLDPGELAGASLITASALLDMLTEEELRRFVAVCARAGCAVLITLTVVGRVELTPADPLDQRVADAFNAHQRRTNGEARRLGPDAVRAAVDGFTRLGRDVVVRPSAWQLGPHQRELAAEWFTGWLAAACEQAPELAAAAPAY
ncbi:MAG: class I SAM-dependent methyltransferase, partial [Nocardioidaceae bacterium]